MLADARKMVDGLAGEGHRVTPLQKGGRHRCAFPSAISPAEIRRLVSNLRGIVGGGMSAGAHFRRAERGRVRDFRVRRTGSR